MITNCIVTIKNMSGTKDSKSLNSLSTDVRALILPAGNDIMALYPDYPIGQTFSYIIVSDTLGAILPEAEIKVTDAMIGELAVNDTYIVRGDNRKNKVAGQMYHTGVCVRKDA